MRLLAFLLLLACHPDEPDPTACVAEVCNGVDDDCDGAVDEDATDALVFYVDADEDGYGTGSPLTGCTLDGAALDGDCDDTTPTIHPGATERCDGVDEDCDALVDEDATDPVDWWPDADGDGYGDASATPVLTCDPPDGHVTDATDCDDAAPEIHPTAPEICNGFDDDCDEATGEYGTALFVHEDGATVDLTKVLSGGSWQNPIVQAISDPGTLHLCGKLTASLRLRADVAIVGHDAELSGGGSNAPIVIRRPITASITDLVLSDGSGVDVVLGELSAGGGIACNAAAALSLSGVTIERCTADVGAGLYASSGCALTAEDSRIRFNESAYYGGGLAVVDATASLTGVELTDNTAVYGGGLAVVAYEGTAEGTLTDVLVEGNTADQGGGAIVEGASLRCAADPSLTAGFLDNAATDGGGVFLDGGTLASEGCDWGEGSDDNAPEDVSSSTLSFGDDATFACDDTGCVE